MGTGKFIIIVKWSSTHVNIIKDRHKHIHHDLKTSSAFLTAFFIGGCSPQEQGIQSFIGFLVFTLDTYLNKQPCGQISEILTLKWSHSYVRQWLFHCMMTSSNASIFRVTGPLCGEFTGHRWIPLTKASDAELWCFLDLRLNKRLSKQS